MQPIASLCTFASGGTTMVASNSSIRSGPCRSEAPSASRPTMSTATGASPRANEMVRATERAVAASAGAFSFYDATVSADGSIASIGKPFDSEIDAQKSCARSGKPYLKIETLRVEFVVLDGKLVAVATPAKKQ